VQNETYDGVPPMYQLYHAVRDLNATEDIQQGLEELEQGKNKRKNKRKPAETQNSEETEDPQEMQDILLQDPQEILLQDPQEIPLQDQQEHSGEPEEPAHKKPHPKHMHDDSCETCNRPY